MPVTSVQQVTPAGLKLVMDFADQCKAICENGNGSCELLKGKIMAAIFYEASTRTNCSFQAAMLRCLLTSVCVCLTSRRGIPDQLCLTLIASGLVQDGRYGDPSEFDTQRTPEG